MEPKFQLELTGSELDEARVAQLTRILKQKLTEIEALEAGSITVREKTRPAAVGEKFGGEVLVIGALNIFVDHLAKGIADELRARIVVIAKAWLGQLTDKVVLRIQGEGQPDVLTSPTVAGDITGTVGEIREKK